ncbi:MAG: alpha/beta hydrolase [Spirochaetaceae bacterium]|jgi:pimeloyl-ACP methyl ester carboxylesterase|nr:alpha/beta hydrolase [Spirochaetaceae bacterium]
MLNNEFFKSEYIKCEEGVLRVITAGKTGKAVLLLSGGGLDNALLSWKHLIPALSKDYRVFAIDWPKQGGSSPWNGVAGHQCLLKCVDAVLTYFKIETASFIGLSQGGAVTLAYTILHPETVEKLAVISPAGVIRFPAGFHQLLWLSAKLTWLTNGVSRLFFINRRTAEWSLKMMFPVIPKDFDSIVDDVLEEARINGVGASDWQNNSISFFKMNVYLTPELHRISCPALLIQGGKDAAVKPKHTKEAAKRIPKSKLIVLENHGHWSNRQSPEIVNKLILDFLNK